MEDKTNTFISSHTHVALNSSSDCIHSSLVQTPLYGLMYVYSGRRETWQSEDKKVRETESEWETIPTIPGLK